MDADEIMLESGSCRFSFLRNNTLLYRSRLRSLLTFNDTRAAINFVSGVKAEMCKAWRASTGASALFALLSSTLERPRVTADLQIRY